MRLRPAAVLVPLVLSACATPGPFIAPATVGKGPGEVSRLVPASDAKLFACSIVDVKGSPGVDLGGKKTSEVTLPPGRYHVTLHCASAQHFFTPEAQVVARPGKIYTLTGYLIDDSITIFTMKMRVKVTETS